MTLQHQLLNQIMQMRALTDLSPFILSVFFFLSGSPASGSRSILNKKPTNDTIHKSTL